MLDGPQRRVHQDHGENDHRALHVVGKHRHRRRRDQDQHQQILELFQENLPGFFSISFFQGIFPHPGADLLRLGAGKALAAASHLPEDLLP